MALTDNITLVVTPDAAILADVTASGENKAVATETDANGNTIYKVIEIPADPAIDYAASIAAGENTSYFDTLASAHRTVQDGQTIKLLKDNSETVEVSKAVSFTLDTSGISFTGSIKPADGFILSQNGSTYTISAYTPSTGGSGVTRYEVSVPSDVENG